MSKPFSWSYSKLKNFASCPKRYYNVDIAKAFKEAPSEALTYGDELHKAFQNRIGKGKPLPKGFEQFEDHCVRLLGVGGTQKVEQKLAITKELGACEFFAKDAWFRSIADFLTIKGSVALVIDYKTGKVLEDSEQLALMAECVFSHYPEVQAVRAEFWWLKDDAVTREDFRRHQRKDTWARVLPRVLELKHAHDTMEFPPKPGFLCRKWCPVASCPHHGG